MYVPNPDPRQPGTFYFLVTPAVGTNVQFFSSTDLVNFSPIVAIDIASMVPGATVAWSPEWWHDPQDGTDYFFVAVSTDPEGAVSSTAPMMPYLVPFSPATGAVTGDPIEIGRFFTTQNRTFDFFPYYDGSKYYPSLCGSAAGRQRRVRHAADHLRHVVEARRSVRSADLHGHRLLRARQLPHRSAHHFPRGGERMRANRIRYLDGVADGSSPVCAVYRDSCPASGALFSQTSLVDGPAPLIILGSSTGRSSR